MTTIEMEPHHIIYGGMALFIAGAIFGAAWWRFVKRHCDNTQPASEHPQACPLCESRSVAHCGEWNAESCDPCDHGNCATLDEHQCRDCGRSFWV